MNGECQIEHDWTNDGIANQNSKMLFGAVQTRESAQAHIHEVQWPTWYT